MRSLLIVAALAIATPAAAEVTAGPFEQYCNYEDTITDKFYIGACMETWVQEGDRTFAVYKLKRKIIRIEVNVDESQSGIETFRHIRFDGEPGYDIEVNRNHHIYSRGDHKMKLEVANERPGGMKPVTNL